MVEFDLSLKVTEGLDVAGEFSHVPTSQASEALPSLAGPNPLHLALSSPHCQGGPEPGTAAWSVETGRD